VYELDMAVRGCCVQKTVAVGVLLACEFGVFAEVGDDGIGVVRHEV
jgi:hypothetical protein